MRENFKIILCENAGRNNTLKENCEKTSKKLNLNLSHQALHRKMVWYDGSHSTK